MRRERAPNDGIWFIFGLSMSLRIFVTSKMKTTYHLGFWRVWDDAGVDTGVCLCPVSSGVNGVTNGQLVWEIWVYRACSKLVCQQFWDRFACSEACLQRLLVYMIEASSRQYKWVGFWALCVTRYLHFLKKEKVAARGIVDGLIWCWSCFGGWINCCFNWLRMDGAQIWWSWVIDM